MTAKDLRQACPEFFDFVVRLSNRIANGHHLQDPETADLARALLAKLEAEKVSAKGGDCPARPSDKPARWASVAREVSTTPATEKGIAEPVKPQERSAEEDPGKRAMTILGARGSSTDLVESKWVELTASVRALRADRDHYENYWRTALRNIEDHQRALAKCESERDELAARVEKVLGRVRAVHPGMPCSGLAKGIEETLAPESRVMPGDFQADYGECP